MFYNCFVDQGHNWFLLHDRMAYGTQAHFSGTKILQCSIL